MSATPPHALAFYLLPCVLLLLLLGQQQTTPRRRFERVEKKDPLKEKRVQLQPAVAKEVQSFITAKRKEARGMVLGR